MQISPILIQDDKLLQFIDSGTGFSFSLFRKKESQHNSFSNLDLLQTQINSLNELPQFKTYFDTLQQLKMYIQQPSYLKACKDGKVQVYASHPIKKNQNLKIGEIKLKERTQNNEQDFSLINKLCMSEKDLQNHEIKSILLRLSRQLEKVSEKCQYEKQNSQSIKLIQTCHQIVEKAEDIQITSNQENMSFVKIIEESLQREMGVFRNIIVKKMELMSSQIEINKQFVLDQIGQIKQQLSVDGNFSQKINNIILQQKQQKQQSQQKQQEKQEQEEKREDRQEKKEEVEKEEEENEKKRQQTQEEGQEGENEEEEIDDDQQYLVLTKIKDILPRYRINIIAKVLSVSRRGRMANVVLGDQTGIVKAFLYHLSIIKCGNVILLEDCVSKLRNNHIQIVLHREGGFIQETTEEINKVNVSNNVSSIEYEEIQE